MPQLRLYRRFPGETEREFEQTLKLVKDIAFDLSFVFIYSPRPGTPAANLHDDTPHEEKVRRLEALNEVIEAETARINQTMVGTVQRCLVEVLGLRQTKCFKVFLDGIVLQHFRAGNIERADGRTLNHGQQDLIVHGLDAYVVKETGCVEFFDDSSLRASLKLSPTLTGRC